MRHCYELKAEIITPDEHESEMCATDLCQDYGHAHAIEDEMDYCNWLHGELRILSDIDR
ncbi:MAG: hypothetical protein ACFC1C_00165 [Candidatus Malihini olakiniferum]